MLAKGHFTVTVLTKIALILEIKSSFPVVVHLVGHYKKLNSDFNKCYNGTSQNKPVQLTNVLMSLIPVTCDPDPTPGIP